MTTDIRPIAHDDIPELLKLMREFAEYESLSEYLTATQERLHSAMFGEAAFVQGLFIVEADQNVGYALFYPSFSSFRAERSMYLEDLFIRESHRGHGLGRKVLSTIAALASRRGFERIDFLVLDWNTTAIDFYKRLGAQADRDERHFRIVDEAFRSLAL